MAARRNRPSRARSTSERDETGAGAQTTGVGAGAQAGHAGAGAEVTSDIGQAEAYITNLKRVVENAITADQNLQTLNQSILASAQQAVQNAVTLQNRVSNLAIDRDQQAFSQWQAERERTVREGDLAIDRWWNIDEVSLASLSATIATVTANVLSQMGAAPKTK